MGRECEAHVAVVGVQAVETTFLLQLLFRRDTNGHVSLILDILFHKFDEEVCSDDANANKGEIDDGRRFLEEIDQDTELVIWKSVTKAKGIKVRFKTSFPLF